MNDVIKPDFYVVEPRKFELRTNPTEKLMRRLWWWVPLALYSQKHTDILLWCALETFGCSMSEKSLCMFQSPAIFISNWLTLNVVSFAELLQFSIFVNFQSSSMVEKHSTNYLCFVAFVDILQEFFCHSCPYALEVHPCSMPNLLCSLPHLLHFAPMRLNFCVRTENCHWIWIHVHMEVWHWLPGRNNGRNFSGIRALTAVKISHRSRY